MWILIWPFVWLEKSKEDQNDTNSKSAQRADSFVSPPVNMNGDVADKQVRDINGDADVSDENVNRFIGTPNEPKHLSKRAPPSIFPLFDFR